MPGNSLYKYCFFTFNKFVGYKLLAQFFYLKSLFSKSWFFTVFTLKLRNIFLKHNAMLSYVLKWCAFCGSFAKGVTL